MAWLPLLEECSPGGYMRWGCCRPEGSAGRVQHCPDEVLQRLGGHFYGSGHGAAWTGARREGILEQAAGYAEQAEHISGFSSRFIRSPRMREQADLV